MNEKKNDSKLNNKDQLSEIHLSILDLYSYLKLDKLQLVSKKIKNNYNI
jgi:hypothetical protein